MISVVTITFNNPDELEATLASIAGAQGIESVVVDGGQNEDSRRMLAAHAGKVISESDRGISDAFNKGVLHSAGEAIAFLNSGDVCIRPDYYSWADRRLREDPGLDFVFSDIFLFDPLRGERLMRPRGAKIVNLGKGMPFPHPSMVVRKSVFERVGFFSLDYKIAMDFDFAVRLVRAGMRGCYFPHATVKMDGGGISIRRELQGIQECRMSLSRHRMFSGVTALAYYERLLRYHIRRFLR
jgi:GT2 family glycosyltransferase